MPGYSGATAPDLHRLPHFVTRDCTRERRAIENRLQEPFRALSDGVGYGVSAQASLRLVAHAATHAMRAGCFPDDDPLDERGLAEATALRDQWSIATEATTVLCSPARCARQTAVALGVQASIDAALRDADYGCWRGKRLRDVTRDAPADLDAWIHDPRSAPHGGESFESVLRRVGAWMDALPAQGDVIAITHAVVVRAAILHALRAEQDAVPRIDVVPLSCTTFALSSDGWKLAAG